MSSSVSFGSSMMVVNGVTKYMQDCAEQNRYSASVQFSCQINTTHGECTVIHGDVILCSNEVQGSVGTKQAGSQSFQRFDRQSLALFTGKRIPVSVLSFKSAEVYVSRRDLSLVSNTMFSNTFCGSYDASTMLTDFTDSLLPSTYVGDFLNTELLTGTSSLVRSCTKVAVDVLGSYTAFTSGHVGMYPQLQKGVLPGYLSFPKTLGKSGRNRIDTLGKQFNLGSYALSLNVWELAKPRSTLKADSDGTALRGGLVDEKVVRDASALASHVSLELSKKSNRKVNSTFIVEKSLQAFTSTKKYKDAYKGKKWDRKK